MKYRKSRIFNYPADVVTKILLDTDQGYDMQELENVTAWKVIEEKDIDDRRVATKEWCAHSQIPKSLQHIISPKMLTWFEHSEWNRKTKTYSFVIVPHYLKKQVTCKGKTVFLQKGADKCDRTFEIELKVDIPIVGIILENLVLNALKQNEEQDFLLSVKAIEKALKK
ncbi:MAG TPA: DUF2505 family protein [bacterium]|nr:DUF2505 family protein [bacterium]